MYLKLARMVIGRHLRSGVAPQNMELIVLKSISEELLLEMERSFGIPVESFDLAFIDGVRVRVVDDDEYNVTNECMYLSIFKQKPTKKERFDPVKMAAEIVAKHDRERNN